MEVDPLEQIEHEEPLKGPDRVAAMLLAMGPPVARRLLPHFEPEELKQISQAATALGAVPADEVEPLIEEFTSQFAAGLSLLGSSRAVEEMLSGVLEPEEIERLITGPMTRKQQASVWQRLGGLAEGVLARYLTQEHPQTIAFVLNRLDSNVASATIRDLPEDQQNDILRRMLCARKPSQLVERIVEETLKAELLGGGAPVAETTRHEHLAKILNGMSGEEIDRALKSLEDVRPKAVEKLKGLLFSFADLGKLSDQARATILERVPVDKLVLALADSSDEFRDKVLSTLSSRERRIAENELKNRKEPNPRDVRSARRAIADIALQLSDEGAISLKPDGNKG